MNPCSQDQLICRYHDGQLDAQAARRVEEHVAGCAECASHLAQLRRLSALLVSIGRRDITAAEEARMHGTVENLQLRVHEWAILRIGVSLAALAASVLVVTSVCLVANIGRGAAGTTELANVPMGPSNISNPGANPGGSANVSQWMVRNLGGEGSW